MINRYRRYKKAKIEEDMKEFIKYNRFAMKTYESYPEKIEVPKEFEDKYAICMSYGEDALNKFKKYNLDQELVDEQTKTQEEALMLFYERRKKIKRREEEEKERNKINLYKKAIIELREEGKI